MKDGFIKVAKCAPKIRVCDCDYNAKNIVEYAKEAHQKGASVILFPELSVTGCSCGDLFYQSALVKGAENALCEICKGLSDIDAFVVVGMPVISDEYKNSIFDCAVCICKGEIIGIVPKSNILSNSEHDDARYFTSLKDIKPHETTIAGQVTIMGQMVFCCEKLNDFVIGVEFGDDLMSVNSPSVKLAQNGATLILAQSNMADVVTRRAYYKTAVLAMSQKLICAYSIAAPGFGESTQDLVYTGFSFTAQRGKAVAESDEEKLNGITYADVDLSMLSSLRRKASTFESQSDILKVYFDMSLRETPLTTPVAKSPFVLSDDALSQKRCEKILALQAAGLAKRLEHIGCKSAVIGLSGGLDSTLAFIATVKAFDLLGLDRKGIIAVTMPCFGTTDRTKSNAFKLSEAYGVTLREINITKSVMQHFEDIEQDPSNHDVTYENAQARERTQVLMDIANQTNGMVIGTGDLSELALGFATYNGDHMSMYGVNASIPKTLMRHIVKSQAKGEFKEVLLDILNTPVSPELLPPEENGSIAQKTEDIVGPYELHDFFLYYMVSCSFAPAKILRIAKFAFKGIYDDATIEKWLKIFVRRFFTQQFKRSCLPDGAKVGSLSFSPRGDWKMPSDAISKLWLDEI